MGSTKGCFCSTARSSLKRGKSLQENVLKVFDRLITLYQATLQLHVHPAELMTNIISCTRMRILPREPLPKLPKKKNYTFLLPTKYRQHYSLGGDL